MGQKKQIYMWLSSANAMIDLQLHPHTNHTVTPGFVDIPRWSDGAAGQMERYAGWWTKHGMIGLPHKQGSRECATTKEKMNEDMG